MFLLCIPRKGIIKMAKKLNSMEIVKEQYQNGFIDDHDGREKTVTNVVILCKPYRDKMYVCPVMGSYCCLNPLYFCEEDGRLHLSMGSVGGDLDARGVDIDHAVHKYNAIHSLASEYSMSLESLMLVKGDEWVEKYGK